MWHLNTVKYPISEHGTSPNKSQLSIPLKGMLSHQNPTVQDPDRPSREHPFANRDDLVIGGSLSGYSIAIPIINAPNPPAGPATQYHKNAEVNFLTDMTPF
jgi:hypothetical protein